MTMGAFDGSGGGLELIIWSNSRHVGKAVERALGSIAAGID